MRTHSQETMDQLKALDSPTVSNAIERFGLRPRIAGFAGFDLRCVFPELGTMLGHAVTCTVDSTTEERPNPRGLMPLWEAIDRSPKPAVLVMKDIGTQRNRSCHLGEVMATTAKALGAIGCVTDGGLRDILEIRNLGGFQLFCGGFVVSHGNPVVCEVGNDVEISGMKVRPDDLLHGDVNGLLVIPADIAERVPEEATRVRSQEKSFLDFVRSPGFSLQSLREFQQKLEH